MADKSTEMIEFLLKSKKHLACVNEQIKSVIQTREVP